jgi:fluoride exporter
VWAAYLALSLALGLVAAGLGWRAGKLVGQPAGSRR